MCVACIEFIKGTLNVSEFKSALRETTQNDERHLSEVSEVIGKGFGSGASKAEAEALREKLKNLVSPARS